MTDNLQIEQLQQMAESLAPNLGVKKTPRIKFTSSGGNRYSIFTSRILLNRSVMERASPATRQFILALMMVYARDGQLVSRILRTSLMVGLMACITGAMGVYHWLFGAAVMVLPFSIILGHYIGLGETHQILIALDADEEVARLMGPQVALSALREYQTLLNRDTTNRACYCRLTNMLTIATNAAS